MTAFADFAFSPALARSVAKAGYDTPTPIQAQAIPPQLEGRDVLALAQTGSGKTAAFALPLVERLGGRPGRRRPATARALILAPTRELAVQIEGELLRFGGSLGLSTALILGGVPRGRQIRAMAPGVDVLVATPGRLLDLMSEGAVRLDAVEVLILDEADRMLDMGFVRDVRKIAAATPASRRTALVSATMPAEVEGLAAELLRDPVRVEAAPLNSAAPDISQRVEFVTQADKRARLAALLRDPDVTRAIVFARTKRGADRVAKNLLADGVSADAIHGDKAQNARQRALDGFRSGRVKALVATDIAARGIDVAGVSHVVIHDLPDEPESYVHRIGRTGRNGATGIAITLCDPGERDKLAAIERITRTRVTAEGGFVEGPATAPRGAKPAGAPRPGAPRRRRGGRRAAA
ncbi:DEAD/DEAH box helicase [Rubrimonas sp.]|uniref:DEAD/DEAH box helicase n=1 Tax=Rubrimonas sp. TaxID=2036015 RepID=UPI002FDE9956